MIVAFMYVGMVKVMFVKLYNLWLFLKRFQKIKGFFTISWLIPYLMYKLLFVLPQIMT